MRWPAARPGGGLGIAAISYVAIDYLRHLSPTWHERLQPVLWSVLALIAITRVPFYKHWSSEFRSVLPFLGSIIFMLSTLLFEALSVRFVTAVLGLDWHSDAAPLPDTGQWFLLALNEKLPYTFVEILRARIIGLHHYLMLFIMLAFSVLFDSVKAPGLGLGARYIFTMAIGRFLRAITFVSTILPSARPWCANARFRVPAYPHHWAQKYYVPYATDSNAIRQLLREDIAYAVPEQYLGDYRPDWGSMSFLIDFLRPTASEGSTWYHLLKKAGGGCNDLIYSGHMLVAVLTAMAWTEAYGGFTSALIWLLVLHSAQREVRERHHYSVDCIVAIYVGILLWKMTGFIWPTKNTLRERKLAMLEKIQNRLTKAAKDSNIEQVRELLEEVEQGSEDSQSTGPSKGMWLFAGATIFSTLTIVLLAFTWTSDGSFFFLLFLFNTLFFVFSPFPPPPPPLSDWTQRGFCSLLQDSTSSTEILSEAAEVEAKWVQLTGLAVRAKKQTFSSFDDLLVNSDKPVLVDFYATCAELKDKIQVVKIDTEKYPSIANKYKIEALPTFIIFKDGEPFDRFEGAMPVEQLNFEGTLMGNT
ncbi:hypothetical protein F8388_000406 [Cannabis sativa]|uniref:Sphingomyelin synthase-like domain-containing protein n=1 Tax=Cannabis sativa TaxID=3483 RepID=A0A7J6E062_CANSA|nr:hypothetical protein F8388_000406 [Cannabis sativa]